MIKLILIIILICLSSILIIGKSSSNENFCVDKNWVFFENPHDINYNYVKPFSQEKINASLPNSQNNNIHYAYMGCSNNCQQRPTSCSPKNTEKITGTNVNPGIYTTS